MLTLLAPALALPTDAGALQPVSATVDEQIAENAARWLGEFNSRDLTPDRWACNLFFEPLRGKHRPMLSADHRPQRLEKASSLHTRFALLVPAGQSPCLAFSTAHDQQTDRSMAAVVLQNGCTFGGGGKHMHAEALPYWGKARPPAQGVDAKPYHLLAHH